MKNLPILPPPSADWGRAMSQTIDETDAAIDSIRSDIDARLSGSSVWAQSLLGQANMIEGAISASQPIAIANTTSYNIIIGTEPTPVTKVSVSITIPSGYNSVMLQAFGRAYIQQVDNGLGGRFPVESQIAVVGGSTEYSLSQFSPIQDWDDVRYFLASCSYVTFVPNVTGSIVVQLRMRNGGGTAVYDNGANTASLSVLANFYKGEVLQPPA